jgi:hypothetical protein
MLSYLSSRDLPFESIIFLDPGGREAFSHGCAPNTRRVLDDSQEVWESRRQIRRTVAINAARKIYEPRETAGPSATVPPSRPSENGEIPQQRAGFVHSTQRLLRRCREFTLRTVAGGSFWVSGAWAIFPPTTRVLSRITRSNAA